MRAIDGDALRDKLQNLADDEWNQSTTTSWAEAFYACADIVADAPTIEPERETGKWIYAVLPNDNGGLPVQVCDQCNTFFPLAYTGGGHHYCPNCGARMEEPEDIPMEYFESGGR